VERVLDPAHEPLLPCDSLEGSLPATPRAQAARAGAGSAIATPAPASPAPAFVRVAPPLDAAASPLLRRAPHDAPSPPARPPSPPRSADSPDSFDLSSPPPLSAFPPSFVAPQPKLLRPVQRPDGRCDWVLASRDASPAAASSPPQPAHGEDIPPVHERRPRPVLAALDVPGVNAPDAPLSARWRLRTPLVGSGPPSKEVRYRVPALCVALPRQL